MRKFIEKINSWIQWTKQWNFFHVFFVGSFLMYNWIPFVIMYIYFIGYVYDVIIKYISEERFDWILYIADTLKWYLSAHLHVALFALFVTGIIFIKKWKNKQPMKVQSSFLLKNQFYEFIYVNSVLAFVFSFSLYTCFTINVAFCDISFSFLLFPQGYNILAWINRTVLTVLFLAVNMHGC